MMLGPFSIPGTKSGQRLEYSKHCEKSCATKPGPACRLLNQRQGGMPRH